MLLYLRTHGTGIHASALAPRKRDCYPGRRGECSAMTGRYSVQWIRFRATSLRQGVPENEAEDKDSKFRRYGRSMDWNPSVQPFAMDPTF